MEDNELALLPAKPFVKVGKPLAPVGHRLFINVTDRCNNDYYVRQSIGDLVYYGVFDRHPDLKVVSGEHELSWVPFFINRLDLYYIDRPDVAAYRFSGNTLPSDFMRRNVYHSFQEDALGIELRHHLGVNQLMWDSDYPHAESTFPESMRILDEIMVGVPKHEKQKIIGGNAVARYGFV